MRAYSRLPHMAQTKDNQVVQPDAEDIPDDDPIVLFEWIDKHIEISLNRWKTLEENRVVQNPSFERPQSVAAFRQRILELFSDGIASATLGRGGGLIQCANSVPFAVVVWRMARFESHEWVRAILGQDGLAGKLAHISILTSAHDIQYPQLDGTLF